MGDFLWTFAAEEAVKKVVKVAAEQVGLVSGFEDHLSNLQIWLCKAEDFLCDINSRKLHHHTARTWVSNLHHLAVQADNLLDEIVYEHHRRKLQASKLKKVTNFVSPSTNAFIFRRNMAKKMKILIELLEKHYNEAAAPLGLEGIKYARPEIDVISQLRETISELDDHKIVGRDTEVESIVKQVIDASNQHGTSILPIVGMGGLGKTTVAKLVFNHEMIKKHFDKIVWVCVSEPFIVNKILGDILQNLTPNSNVGDNNREVLLHELQKEMQGQRYFFVLDDVWNDNAFLWDELKYCLLRITGNSKNCIVVTTRSVDVAKIMETCPSNHLNKLLDDQCWSLFRESANACGIPMTSNLEIVRKELVKKIGGLPLVARVLGRAVKFEGDDERWVKVLEGVLRTPLQEENFVLSILKLSVDRLPSSSLKQCFAYCSNFPKDYVFEKQELVQMWMAQGFIRPQEERNSTTMENIGDMYFHNLLSRCLFQDVIKDDQGRIKGCKMHDLIHDVACAISSDQDLKLNPSIIIGKELQKKVESKKVARTLHTIYFVQMIPCNIDQKVFGVKIKNFVSLRVLKMSLFSQMFHTLPDSIGQLKHLRYLEISNVRKLPKSISLLYNLQTLKITSSIIENLPETIRNLVNLRHVEFQLPVKKIPPQISQLTQLQTLSCFVVGFEKGCKITELGHLKNLQGRLELFDLEKVENKEEASRANLEERENLDELEFTWSLERKDNRYNDLEVLEGLQPNKNIQSLKIFDFAGICLPDKIFVENLRVIGLHGCKNCKKLPMLGQLNSLKKLEIEFLDAVQSIGNEFYGNDSNQRTFFPKLEIFILSGMINLEQWGKITTDNASSNYITSFPYLKELRIERCPKLLNIPDVFGGCDENDVQHLEILWVSHCNKLTKLPNGLHLCGSIQQVRIPNGSNLSINLRNKPKLWFLSIGPLEKLPEDLCHVKNLSAIKIVGCMQNYDFSLLHSLPSLERLCLVESLSSVTQLPQQLQHLTVLQFLSIVHFEGIEVLPEWLGNFVSLHTLSLSNCKILKQLPSTEAMLRLTNLRELCAYECPLLPVGEGGTEKIKLSQLPTIKVDLNSFVSLC